MHPNVQSALVRTDHLKDYMDLCTLIDDHTFPWGYNKPSHVLIKINNGCAWIVTAITMDNVERLNWMPYMTKKHDLELKDPVNLNEFSIKYATYKLTEDLDIFKCE